MTAVPTAQPLTARLAEALYVEALLLADETRAYFDEEGRAARERLGTRARVVFACEALKATTRLLHVIAGLSRFRNGDGETGEGIRQATASGTDPLVLERLPEEARRLVRAGMDLVARVERLAGGMTMAATPSPARALIQRLERAF